MFDKARAIIADMSGSVQEPTAMRWLRHGLYALVIYNVIFLALPLHELLWGPDSLKAIQNYSLYREFKKQGVFINFNQGH